MNYICKVQTVVLTVGLVSVIAIDVRAQKPEEELVCYLRQANGAVMNLTGVCGVGANSRNQRDPSSKTSLTEKQAQFIQAFYQKLHDHPQEKEVLAQVDPDALIGKANQVCTALRDGTYEPPPNLQAGELDDRQIPDLEETIVYQVARRYFCPSYNND